MSKHDIDSVVIRTASERLENTAYYPGVDVMPRRMAVAALDYLRIGDPSIPQDSTSELRNSLIPDHGIMGGVFALGYFAVDQQQNARCVPWVLSPEKTQQYTDFSLMTHAAPLGELQTATNHTLRPIQENPAIISAFAYAREDASPLLLFEWTADVPPSHVKMIAQLARKLSMADVKLMVKWQEVRLQKW